MKRFILVPFAVFSLILFSCKNKTSEETTPSEPDFVQLKVGNYWIYEFYKVDTNGVEKKLTDTDSSYILKDTLIDGINYFVKIYSPIHTSRSGNTLIAPDTAFIRDSSGYLLMRHYTGESRILFSRDNFSDVLFTDTIATLLWRQEKMTGKDSVVSVPAGTFKTRSLCMICYPLQQSYPWGIRKFYYIYGEGVGQIKYTYAFYNQPDHFEARLIRYRVN